MNSFKEYVKFLIESEQPVQGGDERYMELAQYPEENAEELQGMVDGAAKSAGYSVEGFHGTSGEIPDVFIPQIGSNAKGIEVRPAVFFAIDKNFADMYAQLSSDRGGGVPVVQRAYLRLGKSVEKFSTDETVDDLKERGFSSSINKDVESGDIIEYAVFDPRQIKSADPVTYDKRGGITPLSRRFDKYSNSIKESKFDRALGLVTSSIDPQGYGVFLTENSKFRKKKNLNHLVDVQMFSVFVDKSDFSDDEMSGFEKKIPQIKKDLSIALRNITKMGFPKMHANIVIKDVSDTVNQNTGGGVGGWASRSHAKHMSVGSKFIDIDDSLNETIRSHHFVNIVVHEWAHLWMFNNSKGFKRAVYDYYQEMIGGDHMENDLDTDSDHWAGSEEDREFSNLEHELQDKMDTDGLSKKITNMIGWLVYGNTPTSGDDDGFGGEPVKKPTSKNTLNGVESYEGSIKRIIKEEWDRLELPRFDDDRLIDKVVGRIMQMITTDMYPTVKDMWYASEESEKYSEEFPTEYLEEIQGNYIERVKNGDSDILMDIKDYLFSVTNKLYKHNTLPTAAHNLSGEDKNKLRENLSAIVGWDEYGLSNDDEIWATGVEKFLELPPNHRKSILGLMGK